MLRFTLAAAALLCFTPAAHPFNWLQSPFKIRDGALGYHFDDPITQIHEDTHGVHSLLRKRFGGRCFQVDDSTFVKLPAITGVTIGQVAATCEVRPSTFQLYLVEQRQWWDDQPSYLFGEWVCYTNGAKAGVFGTPPRSRYSDLKFGLHFTYYCDRLVKLIPQREVKGEYRTFWLWNARRCLRIYERSKETGVGYHSQHDGWVRWLRSRLD